jgi:hypothetical protein
MWVYFKDRYFRACSIVQNTVERRLSERQRSEPKNIRNTAGKKKIQVLRKYWLLYLNVNKPVEALQEFIRMSAASAIVWTHESPVTLLTTFCISVWIYY